MAIAFDGPSKLIVLSAGTVGLGVRDLWSRWVDWLADADNSKFLPAMRSVGGDDIDVSAGTSIPVYTYLTNGWRIRPQESSHTLSVVDGILLVEGGGDPFVNTLGSFVVRVSYSQPVQAIAVSSSGGFGPSAADIAAAVWNALSANHLAPGSTGEKLASGSAPTPNEIADAVLNRDMAAVPDTNARTPLNALRFLRNKWSISGTTLAVKKEDDTTTAWEAQVTGAPGADPISGTDPA